MDILRQLLDPSGPRNAQSLALSNHPFIFYPHYALPPAIQFHLPSKFSLNTCAMAIPPLWKIFKVSRSESEKITSIPRQFTSFAMHTKVQLK